jgi:hypothetical protein
MTIVDKSVERLSRESALHTLVTMEDCGAGNGGLREKLLFLEKKLASNQLHLAVLGQIGSTHAHNTRTTGSYFQQVDAAIVVLSVDPSITDGRVSVCQKPQ